MAEKEGIYSIFIDNLNAQKRTVEHLIRMGHKKIAYIAGDATSSLSECRLDGYRSALTEHKIPLDEDLIVRGDFTPVSGYTAVKELLSIRNDFTAIASANDQMALGAIKAIRQMGRNVPEDIAITGFDNLSIASLIDPSLTTIHVPTKQMGNLAVEIICKTADGEEMQRRNQLVTDLIVRKSSDVSAMNEWEL